LLLSEPLLASNMAHEKGLMMDSKF
jgi:hypothetical protein